VPSSWRLHEPRAGLKAKLGIHATIGSKESIAGFQTGFSFSPLRALLILVPDARNFLAL